MENYKEANCEHKRKFNEVLEVDLLDRGRKKINTETNMDENEEVEEETTVIIELGEKAKKDNLIFNKATLLELLRRSPFNGKFTGVIRPLFTKQSIVVNIIKKRDVDNLLEIKKLEYEGEEWEINCKIAEAAPGLTFGVIKIHPSVSEECIKKELERNKVNVGEVYRIKKREGPTFSVRIIFKNNRRPDKIMYAGDEIYVSKYNPGVLICNRCSRGGHLAKYCNSRTPACPICGSKDHGKIGCKVQDKMDPEHKLCANCGGNHHAKFRGCTYYQKEKHIVNTMVDQEIPRHLAKKYIREENNIETRIENYRDQIDARRNGRFGNENEIDLNDIESMTEDEDSYEKHFPAPKSSRKNIQGIRRYATKTSNQIVGSWRRFEVRQPIKIVEKETKNNETQTEKNIEVVNNQIKFMEEGKKEILETKKEIQELCHSMTKMMHRMIEIFTSKEGKDKEKEMIKLIDQNTNKEKDNIPSERDYSSTERFLAGLGKMNKFINS